MHPIQERILKLIDKKNIADLSLREIGREINEPLPQKIKHHLNQLNVKGFIAVEKGNVYRITNRPASKNMFADIPIIGTANCGPASLYADANIEGYLKISKRLIAKHKGIFAIKAEGHSLNKASINGKTLEHGDFAIVDSNQISPRDGDYVLSVIDHMANIKKYKRDDKNRRIVLLSESSQTINPIFVHEEDDFRINGKVIDVVKKFEK